MEGPHNHQRAVKMNFPLCWAILVLLFHAIKIDASVQDLDCNGIIEQSLRKEFTAEVIFQNQGSIQTPLWVSLDEDKSVRDIADDFCSLQHNDIDCTGTIISLVHEVRFILYNDFANDLVAYLQCNGVDFSDADPGSAMYPTKINFLQDFVRSYDSNLDIICEVGFNMGHSALAFLAAGPSSRVISFDILPNDSQGASFGAVAAEFLHKRFPKRFSLFAGDSDSSVQALRNILSANQVNCNLMYVDGGHDYEVVKADFENFYLMTKHAGQIIIADDLNFAGVWQAWSEKVGEGKLKEDFIFSEKGTLFEGTDGKWNVCYNSLLQTIPVDNRSTKQHSAPMVRFLLTDDWEPDAWLTGCNDGRSFQWDTVVGVGHFLVNEKLQ